MNSGEVFEYERYGRYFAQAAGGLEEPAAAEIERAGGTDAKAAYRGVYFNADRAGLYRVNYTARLATRVLAPLLTFDCHSSRYLYKTASSIAWDRLFSPKQTFAVTANVSHSFTGHSKFAALRLKDAVVDWFRGRCGRRPDVDAREPDVWLNLFLYKNRAVISVDTSGGSLHRRGYRKRTVDAPMQETVAAAVIEWCGWDGERPLVDPMCGSGTLVCEALMRYCRVPAAYRRARFGFENLPDFSRDQWDRVRSEALALRRELPAGLISASDADGGAVGAAAANTRELPCGENVALRTTPFERLSAIEPSVIVTNPPYGLRMSRGRAEVLMQGLGDFLKRKCVGSTAYVYFGNRGLLKHIGLRPRWRRPLENGGLDGRLARFDLY